MAILIDRILKSYSKELEDYSNQPKEYKTSGIWTGAEYHYIFGKNIDEKELLNKLSNFPNNELGVGISLLCSNDFVDYEFNIWNKITKLPIEVLRYPKNIGFKGLNIGSIFTISQAFRISYNAFKISELSNGNVVEIGGGFGGIPYHLFKNFKFNRTYLNFDIPYVGLIEKYFLTKIFPKKKFMFYGEDDVKNFKNYDIVLMPHYVIKELPDNCCDLVFNSNSLGEMGSSQIREYLKHIDRISSKYFLHINHERQAMLLNANHDICDVNPLKLVSFSKEEWELPKVRWDRISKEQHQFSNFGDDVEYYEYLYKKL